jgi:hypothetical protein
MKGPVGVLNKKRESNLQITTLSYPNPQTPFGRKIVMERAEVESLNENEVQMDPGVHEPIKSSGPRHPAATYSTAE